MRNLLCAIIALAMCGCRVANVQYELTEDRVLTETQSLWLNIYFDSIRGDFDFTDKKVAFLSSGVKEPANEYFRELRRNPAPITRGTLYILNDSEKMETGGYSAAVSTYSKFRLAHDEIVKKLKDQKYSKRQISPIYIYDQ